jgi:hypothetical protein
MPAYCGSKFYSNLNKGDACPTGGVATFSPNGTNEPEAASAIGEASSLTPTVQWNVNNSPVKVKRPGASYSGGIPAGEVETTIPYYEAQQIANELRGQGGKKYDDFVNKLRGYTGSELGTVGGVDTAWNTVLTDAYSAGVNAFDLLDRGPSMIAKETPGAGVGGGGVGAYTGPRATVTMQAESDIKELADAVAVEMIGRAVSEDEMAKILKRVRKAEVEQPTVTTSRVASTTTQQGLTAEGRRDIIENIVAKKPEYAEFQKATTLMGYFDRALQERMQM